MKLKHSILPQIEAKLEEMTHNERKLAHYFLTDCTAEDNLAASTIAEKCKVSQATLTRFAQKCGFKGYREFTFAYQAPEKHTANDDHLYSVFINYQDLLNKTYSLIDHAQITRVSNILRQKKRIYLYGKGSSGMVANVIKRRLMHIGIICDAITNQDLLSLNHFMLDKDCAVIGISISGKTSIIKEAMIKAKQADATVILLTANHSATYKRYCDEVVLFAVKNHLDHKCLISPQFPPLIVFDIIYADLMSCEGIHKLTT